jgi:hypothetical protein
MAHYQRIMGMLLGNIIVVITLRMALMSVKIRFVLPNLTNYQRIKGMLMGNLIMVNALRMALVLVEI